MLSASQQTTKYSRFVHNGILSRTTGCNWRSEMLGAQAESNSQLCLASRSLAQGFASGVASHDPGVVSIAPTISVGLKPNARALTAIARAAARSMGRAWVSRQSLSRISQPSSSRQKRTRGFGRLGVDRIDRSEIELSSGAGDLTNALV